MSELNISNPADGDLVHTHNLVKVYEAKGRLAVTAVDGIEMRVASGEFTAIAGPSGSGKTTLLNLIGGLDQPTSGWVTVAGQDLSALNRNNLAAFRLHHLGFIFQAFNLIPVLTAEENAEFTLLLQGIPGKERRNRVVKELESLGIGSDLIKRRPHELSGGQQQRVAIARALVSRPKLVLADEPTANLDSRTGANLLTKMRDMNAHTGITFLFSTHDPMVIERARRLITLRDGKIVGDNVQE